MKKRGLRTGYTTGSCAAAAAKAATLALQQQKPVETITIWLPIHRTATFQPINWRITPEEAHCGIIKDAGDDPDVTHGAEICATVTWREEPGIEIRGGRGVGTVTKPGLGLAVGEPAINRVPRRMITYSVEEALASSSPSPSRGIRVTISVPNGEELAKKTTNPRLGILGGISILGTTGIVKPYSTAAWRASVIQAIHVAAANGCQEIVLSTGSSSEKFAQRLRPDLPEMAFVDMGIFTGDALKASVRNKLARVTLCGMIGKLSKIAQGHFQTHVAGNQVDLDFLADIAKQCGAPESILREIRMGNTARYFMEIALTHGLKEVFLLICQLVCQQCFNYIKGQIAIEVFLFDFDGNVLGHSYSKLC